MKKQQFLSCLLIISLSITPLQAGRDSYAALFLPKQLSQLFKHNSQNFWPKIFMGGILAAATTVFFSYFYGNRKALTHLKPWAGEKGKEGIITFQTSDGEHVPLPKKLFKNAETVSHALELYDPTQPFLLQNVSCKDLNFLVPYLERDISEDNPEVKKEKANEIQTPTKNLLSTLNAMNFLALPDELHESIAFRIAQRLATESKAITIKDVLEQLPGELQEIVRKEFLSSAMQKYPEAFNFEGKYTNDKFKKTNYTDACSISTSPDGKKIAFLRKKTVLQENQRISKLNLHILNSKIENVLDLITFSDARFEDFIVPAYISFNRTGTHILCHYVDVSSTVVTKVINVKRKKVTKTFNVHYYSSKTLLSKHGTHVVTTKCSHIYDPDTMQEIIQDIIVIHPTPVRDGSIELKTGPEQVSYKLEAIFLDAHDNVVAVTEDGLVKIWNLEGRLLFNHEYNTDIIAAKTDKLGKNLFVLTKNFIHMFNLEQRKEIKCIKHDIQKIASLDPMNISYPYVVLISYDTNRDLYEANVYNINNLESWVLGNLHLNSPCSLTSSSTPDTLTLIAHAGENNPITINNLQTKKTITIPINKHLPEYKNKKRYFTSVDSITQSGDLLFRHYESKTLYSIRIPINFITGNLTLKQINFCIWLSKQQIPITLNDDQKENFQSFEEEIKEWMKEKYSL